jgi:hypothetical protein
MIYLLINLNGAIVCKLDVHFVAIDIQFMRKYIFNYYEFAKKNPNRVFCIRTYVYEWVSFVYLTICTNYCTCLHVPFTWAKSIFCIISFLPKKCVHLHKRMFVICARTTIVVTSNSESHGAKFLATMNKIRKIENFPGQRAGKLIFMVKKKPHPSMLAFDLSLFHFCY